MKLTGVADIGLGSWELYKAKKSFTELKITEENYISKKRLNLTKIALGAAKMTLIGFATNNIALPILQSNITNYNDLAILASFAAGYAVLVTSILNTNILHDEAFNYKHIQGKLLNNVNIISKDLNSYELHANDSYKLFMLGNKLKTGNPFDEFIFKTSQVVTSWISKFNLDENKEFNFIKNKIFNILEKTGLDKILNNISKNALQKSKIYNSIESNTDINSISNLEFKKYIKSKNPDLIEDTEALKKMIAEINQKAIIKAQKKIIEQNIQLFFTQFILEYNFKNKKDNKNEYLINFFKNINDKTSLNEESPYSEVYKKISAIAKKMSNGENLSNLNSVKSIILYLNNDLIDNNKIKFLNFKSAFELYKKEEINKLNGTNKLNLNIYDDKKATFTEIDLNFDSFKDVVVIKPIKKKWFSNNKID